MAKVFHQLWLFKHLVLSSYVIAQELMRFCQDGGPALIIMKGHGAWIMSDGVELKKNLIRHIFRTVRSHHWRVEGFRGALKLPFFGASRFCQNLKDNISAIRSILYAYIIYYTSQYILVHHLPPLFQKPAITCLNVISVLSYVR